MDPPGYVNVEECEDEKDSAKDWGDDILKGRNPGVYFWGRLCGRKGGVCLGGVVRFALRR